ncbi:GATA zinc finger protein 3 [Rhizina undulata]
MNEMDRLNGGFAMTFATSSPGASTAGQGTTPPICQNCTTSTTPLWRRDEAGSVLCNACGLFLKLHGKPRPISLKTDVIKSRNRVKNSGQPAKKKSLFDSPNGHSVARSENGTPPPGHRKPSSGTASNRSVSPQSRSGTPLPPIAPPSMLYENMMHDQSLMGSQSPLPGLNVLNQPSPGSTCSLSDRHLEQPMSTLDSLITANKKLKTRVAELELVNDLFRGRVGELETSEANARRAEITRREVETQLRICLDQSTKREEDLKRRLDETERELHELRGDHPRKKVRVSDLTA